MQKIKDDIIATEVRHLDERAEEFRKQEAALEEYAQQKEAERSKASPAARSKGSWLVRRWDATLGRQSGGW